MSRAYPDHQQDQVDRELERRLRDMEWHDCKPTKRLGPPAPLPNLLIEIFNAHGMPQRTPEEPPCK